MGTSGSANAQRRLLGGCVTRWKCGYVESILSVGRKHRYLRYRNFFSARGNFMALFLDRRSLLQCNVCLVLVTHGLGFGQTLLYTSGACIRLGIIGFFDFSLSLEFLISFTWTIMITHKDK
jgi:hypothetical protein